MSGEYVFPEIYVEGVHSHRFLCLSESGDYLVTEDKNIASSCRRIFGLIPYEQVVSYIDLEHAKTMRSISILLFDSRSNRYEGYVLEKETSVCLQEISGNYIFTTPREGTSIKEDEHIAYTVTNKLEVRNIRSRCSGLIAFLVDMPWEEPRKTLVVVVNEYGSITARKAT